MSENHFHLQIEDHPDTHLLQTLSLGQQRSVHILQLFDQYYFLERNKGERRPPVQLDELPLLTKLKQGKLLQAEEVLPLLPPIQGFDFVVDDQSEALIKSRPAKTELSSARTADPLGDNLQEALARISAYVQTSPEHSRPLVKDSSEHRQAQQAYDAHPAMGAGQMPLDKSQLSEALPKPKPTDNYEPIEQQTQIVVQKALREAAENQQKQLEKAQQLKADVDQQSLSVQKELDRLPVLQERFEEMNQRLEQWQSEMERHHFNRDSLLSRTAEELASLQAQLRQVLSEGLALQTVLREHRFPDVMLMADKLDCFEDMLDHVVQQRHWVHYLQQQQAFRELESERLQILTRRQTQLKQQVDVLKNSIQGLEQINREILSQDPLAVPEPVPALALHELGRLEHELQMLEADPGLKLMED